jgi:DNA-binding response OmpR family regulator
MDSMIHPARKAILFHLEEKLEAELAACLAATSCHVQRCQAASSAVSGDLVFCTTGPAFHAAKAMFPHLPVIVVSRLPETDEWLDALEAGAADYCAPPFETIHLHWLIETHTGGTRKVAARDQQALSVAAA